MRAATWTVTAALALFATGVVLPACGDDVAPSFLILGNGIPDESCTAGAGTGSYLSAGALDLSVGDRYVVFLSVQNNFPSFAGLTGFQVSDGRVDPATITVTGVDVTLRLNPALLQQAEVLQRFVDLQIPPSIPLSYTVPAGTTIGPGSSSGVVAEVVPPNIGSLLRAIPQFTASDATIQGILDMKVKGKRQDGRAVKTGTFSFPITFCNNCLVSYVYPESVARSPFAQANPDLLVDPDAIDAGCNLGQDQVFENVVCGAFYGGNDCALDRCLGQPAGTLVCESDGAFFPVP